MSADPTAGDRILNWRHGLSFERGRAVRFAHPLTPPDSKCRGGLWTNPPLEAGRPSHLRKIQSVPTEFPKNRSREFR
jgi:hypothetical protein